MVRWTKNKYPGTEKQNQDRRTILNPHDDDDDDDDDKNVMKTTTETGFTCWWDQCLQRHKQLHDPSRSNLRV